MVLIRQGRQAVTSSNSINKRETGLEPATTYLEGRRSTS